MKCPTCSGQGYLLTETQNPLFRRIECHDCDGTGYLNLPTGNNCPACGEPIAPDAKWCDYHKSAEQIERELNQ
ncbi:MAG: hypothetical protein ACM37W_16210 [Actinomycetota bacterium]